MANAAECGFYPQFPHFFAGILLAPRLHKEQLLRHSAALKLESEKLKLKDTEYVHNFEKQK